MLADIASIICIGLILAFLIESPLIYARIKNKFRWIPVNAPPWMLGDDYHYFSILNNFHKKILNKLYSRTKTTPFAKMTFFQFTGNLLNLIPYHIGYLIEDKRLGVLFVKIWNRVFLFISVCLFANEIFKLLGEVPSIVELTVIFLFYFVFYPGPLSLDKRGIVWNYTNHRHMFHFVHTNDLTRGMHSETTAPLLLLSVAWTLSTMTHSLAYLFIVILIFSILLYFQYFAAFIVYAFFSIVLLTYNGGYILTAFLAPFYIALSLYYLHTLKKCPVSAELIAHDDGGKIFKFSKFHFAELILMIFAACYIFVYYDSFLVKVLFSVFSVFYLTNFLYKHQYSRFWSRGATIVVQLMVTVMFVWQASVFGTLLIYSLLILMLIACFIYFVKNSKYLYEHSSIKIHENIDDHKVSEIFGKAYSGLNYATDSIELSYYINLYANSNSILKNYSIQNRGYQEHLRSVCYNYKIVGYSLNEFIVNLTTNPGDWRGLCARENITGYYNYFHEWQYLATNYLFNRKIIDDGMYVNGVWTHQYKALLINIWNSIKGDDYDDVVSLKAR